MKTITIKQDEIIWGNLFDYLWKNNQKLFNELREHSKDEE